MVTNRAVETKPKGRGAGPITAENKRNNAIQNDDEQQITHDMKHMSVNDGSQYHQGGRHNSKSLDFCGNIVRVLLHYLY